MHLVGIFISTATAVPSQSDASSTIQFYSIIWKLGFNLLALDGWQTMTFQDEIHSLNMVIFKSLALVQSAVTFKYRNLSNKDRRNEISQCSSVGGHISIQEYQHIKQE